MKTITENEYKPRLKAPAYNNKYYIKAGPTYKGYNKAELVNVKTGSVLPNCPGPVHGLWLEDAKNTNYDECDHLHIGDAKNYWIKNDGYQRGQTPRLGAVACWDGGKYGHIGMVVQIKQNGAINCAMSEDGGKRWYYRLIPKYNGTYNYSTSKYNWIFQGFIYNPAILYPIGRATILPAGKGLRVRKKPTTRSSIVSYAQVGQTYKVYEITKAQGYTWYRIGTEKWIANNGKWLTYKAI